MTNFAAIREHIEEYEKQLKNNNVSSEEDLLALRTILLHHIEEGSDEAKSLYKRVNYLRDKSLRLNTGKVIADMEQEYYDIHNEIATGNITRDRKESLLKRQREISKTLRFLRH